MNCFINWLPHFAQWGWKGALLIRSRAHIDWEEQEKPHNGKQGMDVGFNSMQGLLKDEKSEQRLRRAQTRGFNKLFSQSWWNPTEIL